MRTSIRVWIVLAGLMAGATSAHAEGLPQLDASKFSPQIIWLVIAFAFLYVIMWRVALPKVGQVLDDRQRRIADNLAKAEALKADAEAASQAYEQALADARAQGQELIREAREAIAEESAKRHGELGEKLNADVAKAEARIAKAKQDAIDSVRDVAVEVAGIALERLTGDAGDKKAVGAVVDAAMKERAS